MIANALSGLARLRRAQAALDHALELLTESLALLEPLADLVCIEIVLVSLAGVLSDWDRTAEAARLLGAAEMLRERTGRLLPPWLRRTHDPDVDGVRGALGNQAFETAWAEGRAMSFDQAVAFAGPCSLRCR